MAILVLNIVTVIPFVVIIFIPSHVFILCVVVSIYYKVTPFNSLDIKCEHMSHLPNEMYKASSCSALRTNSQSQRHCDFYLSFFFIIEKQHNLQRSIQQNISPSIHGQQVIAVNAPIISQMLKRRRG